MNKRNNSLGKPLWLPNKTSVCERDALNVNNTVKFETKSTLDIFKDCYFTLDDNLLAKLPTPPNKYTFNSVMQYCRHFVQSADILFKAFHLPYPAEFIIKNILKNTNAC